MTRNRSEFFPPLPHDATNFRSFGCKCRQPIEWIIIVHCERVCIIKDRQTESPDQVNNYKEKLVQS